VLRDFEAYRLAQDKIDKDYRNSMGWARKCWLNLVNSGKFSSDRTIEEYSKEIWNIQKV
jgi:starch phosphorylase